MLGIVVRLTSEFLKNFSRIGFMNEQKYYKICFEDFFPAISNFSIISGRFAESYNVYDFSIETFQLKSQEKNLEKKSKKIFFSFFK